MSTAIEDPTLVTVHGRRHAKCWHCGKDGSEEKTVSRRLSPIMRTADGQRQTQESLTAELQQEIETWRTTKFVHPKCEKFVIEALLQVIDQLDAEADLLREVQRYVIEHHTEPAFATMIQQLGLDVAS